MSGLHVVRSSLRRVFWSIVAVAVVCCVLGGIFLYGYAIVTDDDPGPTPKGDYVRLFFVAITYWGLALVLTIWWITTPVIVALGFLAASIRRTTAVEHRTDGDGDLPGQPTGEPTPDIG